MRPRGSGSARPSEGVDSTSPPLNRKGENMFRHEGLEASLLLALFFAVLTVEGTAGLAAADPPTRPVPCAVRRKDRATTPPRCTGKPTQRCRAGDAARAVPSAVVDVDPQSL
jgi:hypothetical protein